MCFNTQPRGGGCDVPTQSPIPFRRFQHTAARRRLQTLLAMCSMTLSFQHTAARRRLQSLYSTMTVTIVFQHTAARRRLQKFKLVLDIKEEVSTHSRAEAAASSFFAKKKGVHCFNTQPRGGGCLAQMIAVVQLALFQHTAARRRLPKKFSHP